MRIVYLGSGAFGVDCLNVLKNSDHNLSLIVTGAAQPAGRGRKTRPTAVACWAMANNVPFIQAENVNVPLTIDKIADQKPDLILVIAFGQKISNELIDLPPQKAINVHASLLPKYRGAAPVNWAVINGEKETGVTIIMLAEKMDAGNILTQIKTQIIPDETAGRLHDRLAVLSAPLVVETIDKIEQHTATYTPQDHTKATLAPKLKKSDGFLDFNQPAATLKNKILGLTPWPGASVLYNSKKTGKSEKVTIAQANPVQTSSTLPPGTIDENLNVICSRDALAIIKIKPAAGSLMKFRDFVNGRHVELGDTFEKIEQ